VTKSTKLAFVCIFVLLFAACGDDGDLNNGPGIPPADSGTGEDTGVDTDTGIDVGPDAPDPDTGDPDTGDPDTGDTDADTGTPAEGASCASPTDLGSLAAGQEHVFDTSLLEPASTLDTSCDLGSTGSGVRVFALQVDVTSRVEFWTSLSPSRLDLRDGDCSSPTEVITCTDGGTYTATLEAGKTYHLAVWGDFNVGNFQMRANVQEALCNPSEPNWCDSGELNECNRGTSINTYACAASTCADGASCSGDACSAATAVDLSAGTAVTVSGDTGGYTGTWTSDQMPNCGFSQGASGLDTPYAEMFFEVSGLQQNDQLVVESTSQGDYAFFVLDACGATECLAAVDDSDTGEQRLDWRIPQDGTYLVVIESLAAGDRSFNFEFSKQ
jgi:hypothetical protein